MKLSWEETMRRIARFVAACTGLDNERVKWTGQGGGWPTAPWISLNLLTTRGFGSDWNRQAHNPLVFDDIGIDDVDTVADALEATGHNRETGDGPVRLTTSGTAPGGLATLTDYWIVRIDADRFGLVASRAAAISAVPVLIDITSVGTGSHSIADTPQTRRVGEEILHVVEGHRSAILALQCFADDAFGSNRAQGILERIRTNHALPSRLQDMRDMGLAVANVGNVTVIGGSLSSSATFEPRATLELALNGFDSASEPGTTIERVVVGATIRDPAGDIVDEFDIDVDVA